MKDHASVLLTLSQFDLRLYFSFDLNHNSFLYVNPAFESFFRVKASEVSVYELLARVYLEDLDLLRQTYLKLKPGDFIRKVEVRMLMHDGKERLLELSMFYNINEDRKSKEKILSGYIEDVTDFKAQKDQLNEYYNKKNVILNVISHDLAGPLGSIQNLASLLYRKIRLTEDKEVNQWLGMIEGISKKSIFKIQEFVKQEFDCI